MNDPASGAITWRMNLRSPPTRVYGLLATPDGRARFWAQSAEETGDAIEFHFINGQQLTSHVLERTADQRFALTYFGDSRVTFTLVPDGRGGTDLALVETGVGPGEYLQNLPGWVSLLLALKGAADFGIDLRNGDPARSWETGYVDV